MQTTQESAEYGRNHRSTEDALKDQQDKDQKFKDYKKEVDKFLDDEVRRHISFFVYLLKLQCCKQHNQKQIYT